MESTCCVLQESKLNRWTDRLEGMVDMKNFYAGAAKMLLGFVIGVLIVFVVKNFRPAKRFDGDYERWRKLNLILEQVEKNYVDTIDKAGMTDAAVVAALAKLDPHSVYLPPVKLTESETALAGNFEGIGIQFNVPNDTAVVLSVIPGDRKSTRLNSSH